MKRELSRVALASAVMACAVAGASCAKKEAAAPAAQATPAPAVAAATAHGEAAPASGGSVSGKVLEAIDAAGYTYLRLKTAGGEEWAAVTQAKVAVGSEVTVLVSMPMTDFESKTLGRKFDRIAFGALASQGGAAAVPAVPPPSGEASSHPNPHAPKEPPDVGEIKVKKAEGADGRTVAELFAQKAALKDKPVSIRGKVVKFLPGIMGKNWIHLRDGSGAKETKDHDLTVTTTETTAVGEVVLVKGTVRTDQDFGSGYTYSVIVEDAKLGR